MYLAKCFKVADVKMDEQYEGPSVGRVTQRRNNDLLEVRELLEIRDNLVS